MSFFESAEAYDDVFSVGSSFDLYSEERLMFNNILECGKSPEDKAIEAIETWARSIETKANAQVSGLDIVKSGAQGWNIGTTIGAGIVRGRNVAQAYGTSVGAGVVKGAVRGTAAAAGSMAVQSVILMLWNRLTSCGKFNDGTHIVNSPKFRAKVEKFKLKYNGRIPRTSDIRSNPKLRSTAGLIEGLFFGQTAGQKVNALNGTDVAFKEVMGVPVVITMITPWGGSVDISQVAGLRLIVASTFIWNKAKTRLMPRHLGKGYLIPGAQVNRSGEEWQSQELFDKTVADNSDILGHSDVKAFIKTLSKKVEQLGTMFVKEFTSKRIRCRSSYNTIFIDDVERKIISGKPKFFVEIATVSGALTDNVRDIMAPILHKLTSSTQYDILDRIRSVYIDQDTHIIMADVIVPEKVLRAVEIAKRTKSPMQRARIGALNTALTVGDKVVNAFDRK